MKKSKAYLIGKNLTNEFSKKIYSLILDNVAYENLICKDEEEVYNVLSSKDFCFVNITNPYKMCVVPFLDFKSNLVKETGVCNLIVNKFGKLCGYNTDVQGFVDLLKRNDVDVKGKSVLILGNGATSISVEYALNKLGAKEVYKACRNVRRINEYLFLECPKTAQIIINTTPIGKNINEKPLVDFSNFKNLETVIDCNYLPYKSTNLIEARDLYKGAINGMDMLISQATLNFAFVKNQLIPEEIRREIKSSLLLEKVNLILIGLPTSGKTKICKEMKNLLNNKERKGFFDTDEIIEKATKMSISDIFNSYGESEFRKLESEVCKPLSKYEGSIISTGGGLVVNQRNYKTLAKNGFFIYLKKTEFKDYIKDDKRPLVKCEADLKRLYRERNPIYERIADITISSKSSAKEIIQEACNAIVNN